MAFKKQKKPLPGSLQTIVRSGDAPKPPFPIKTNKKVKNTEIGIRSTIAIPESVESADALSSLKGLGWNQRIQRREVKPPMNWNADSAIAMVDLARSTISMVDLGLISGSFGFFVVLIGNGGFGASPLRTTVCRHPGRGLFFF